MIRLFVAIDLPEDVKDDLSQIKMGIAGAKWMERDQMHLTLRFIGEVDGIQFKELANLLSEIEFKQFEIRLNGVGTFESRGMVRVIWVGVSKSDELLHLQRKIERKLIQFGLQPEERKFFPHITLSRLNNISSNRIGHLVEEYSLYKSNIITVDQIHLYSSKLTPKQAIYRREFSFFSK